MERHHVFNGYHRKKSEKYGAVVGIMTVDPEAEDLILISSGGIIIRLAMDEMMLEDAAWTVQT